MNEKEITVRQAVELTGLDKWVIIAAIKHERIRATKVKGERDLWVYMVNAQDVRDLACGYTSYTNTNESRK